MADPDSPQNQYAKNLRQTFGYPLRYPEPKPGLPASYAENGLQIGDVGYVDEDGVFIVRFNICFPLDHDLHHSRRKDLVGLVGLTTFDPNEAPPLSYAFPSDRVICHGIRSSREANDDLKHTQKFMSCSTSGAILILPSGALRQRLDKKEEEEFRKLAEKHALSWCQSTECASLYLITGFYKTDSWHLASFHDVRPAEQVLLERDNTGRYNWDPTCDYRQSHGGNHNQNQTVLVSGFKIQVREWDSHVWVEKLPSRLHSSIWSNLTFLASSLLHILLLPWKWIVLKLWDHGTFQDVDTSSSHVSRVPALSQPFHPSDVINCYLLQKNPKVQVAITHDNEWLSMLEEDEIPHEDMVERGRFWAFLEERYTYDPNSVGVVYLQRKIHELHSKPGGSDLCGMRKLSPGSSSETSTFSLPRVCSDVDVRQFVITNMRVENSVTCLRRMPIGFYVLVQFNETKRWSKCKPASLNYGPLDGPLDSVIEWDVEIMLPMDSTVEVKFSVHASFEFEPILGNGEVLCMFKRSVGNLAQVGSAYYPWCAKNTSTSSYASLLIVVEEQRVNPFLGWSRHNGNLGDSEDCSCVEVAEATDKGHSALLRFHDGQGTEELKKCAEYYNLALERCPVNHEYYAVTLANFATAKILNSQVHGAASDLDIAITSYREALRLRSHPHPDQPRTLLFLAQALLYRQMKVQREVFVTYEIKKLAMEVQQICSESSYDYQAATLVIQTLKRYQTSVCRKPAGLDEFISELDSSAKIHPWCFDRPYRLVNLSIALRKHFEITGRLSYLENSISAVTEAVQVIFDGHHDKPWILATLGDALGARFIQRGDVADLDNAISMFEEAVKVLPVGHFDKPWILASLGEALRARFLRRGAIADLQIAISVVEDAMKMTPNGYLDRPRMLPYLGDALRVHFIRGNAVAGLDDAVSMIEDTTVTATPKKYFDKLRSLGDTFRVHLIQHVVAALENTIKVTPNGHFHYEPRMLSSLGDAFRVCLVRHGMAADLDNAISVIKDTIKVTPDGYFDKPRMLTFLGNALRVRSMRRGIGADLDSAISMLYNATTATPDSHFDRPWMLASLGDALHERFERHRFAPDLYNAISMIEGALELTPDGHFDRLWILASLGDALSTHLKRYGFVSRLNNTVAMVKDAVKKIPAYFGDSPWVSGSLGHRNIANINNGDYFDKHSHLSETSHVVFIGEIGSGKSSVINLIAADRNPRGPARIFSNARSCTVNYASYNVSIGGRMYKLWDTPGFSTFEFGLSSDSKSLSPPSIWNKLKKFIHERRRRGELDLLLFCFRGTESHAEMVTAYNHFCRPTRQKTTIPVAIAITHLEKEKPAMDGWWKKNEGTLKKLGLEFDGHACLTCLSPHHRRFASHEEICRLILDRCQRQPQYISASDVEYNDNTLWNADHDVDSDGDIAQEAQEEAESSDFGPILGPFQRFPTEFRCRAPDSFAIGGLNRERVRSELSTAVDESDLDSGSDSDSDGL